MKKILFIVCLICLLSSCTVSTDQSYINFINRYYSKVGISTNGKFSADIGVVRLSRREAATIKVGVNYDCEIRAVWDENYLTCYGGEVNSDNSLNFIVQSKNYTGTTLVHFTNDQSNDEFDIIIIIGDGFQ